MDKNWRCSHGWLRGEQCEICNAPKREWVGLTDDDIAQAMYKADAIFTGPMQFRFAKELEAKLRSKNDY